MDEGGLHDSLCEEIMSLQKENTRLKTELAQCQQERDGACNIVEGCNKLLLEQGQREARLREVITLLTTGEAGSFLATRFPATLREAKQALEEDKA